MRHCDQGYGQVSHVRVSHSVFFCMLRMVQGSVSRIPFQTYLLTDNAYVRLRSVFAWCLQA